MRVRTLWLTGLVAAGLTLGPAGARAQDPGLIPERPAPVPTSTLFPDPLTVRAQTDDGALPDQEVPLPLGHNPANKGGIFLAAEFIFWRQSSPIHNQELAVRGFVDADGSVTGTPGTFVGSGAEVLNAKEAGGPPTYQPGLRTTVGYAWSDGTSIDFQWLWLAKAQYAYEATIIPPNFGFGNSTLANSFLYSPVFNFNNNFAGPQNKINGGSPTATYGIWDGADIMTIAFIQRTEGLQSTFRIPIFYNDDFGYRCYGLVGPRFFWIWERFYWRTVNQNPDGTAGPTDAAIYTNIVSNRMYGAFAGFGNEWYIGHGFACNLDLEAAGLLDIIKERAKWELGEKDLPGQIKRAKTDYTIVPEVSATLNMTWFPIENVELRIGYDLMAFFNTIGAETPVDFNVAPSIPSGPTWPGTSTGSRRGWPSASEPGAERTNHRTAAASAAAVRCFFGPRASSILTQWLAGCQVRPLFVAWLPGCAHTLGPATSATMPRNQRNRRNRRNQATIQCAGCAGCARPAQPGNDSAALGCAGCARPAQPGNDSAALVALVARDQATMDAGHLLGGHRKTCLASSRRPPLPAGRAGRVAYP